jgi:hypothetical protein
MGSGSSASWTSQLPISCTNGSHLRWQPVERPLGRVRADAHREHGDLRDARLCKQRRMLAPFLPPRVPRSAPSVDIRTNDSDFKTGVGARTPRRVHSRPPPRGESGERWWRTQAPHPPPNLATQPSRGFKLNTDLLAPSQMGSRDPLILAFAALQPGDGARKHSRLGVHRRSESMVSISHVPLPSRAPRLLLARRLRTSRA